MRPLWFPLSCGIDDRLEHFLDIPNCISIVQIAFKFQFGQIENQLAFGIAQYHLHLIVFPRRIC